MHQLLDDLVGHETGHREYRLEVRVAVELRQYEHRRRIERKQAQVVRTDRDVEDIVWLEAEAAHGNGARVELLFARRQNGEREIVLGRKLEQRLSERERCGKVALEEALVHLAVQLVFRGRR